MKWMLVRASRGSLRMVRGMALAMEKFPPKRIKSQTLIWTSFCGSRKKHKRPTKRRPRNGKRSRKNDKRLRTGKRNYSPDSKKKGGNSKLN